MLANEGCYKMGRIRKITIELITDGRTWRGVMRGLTPEELELCKRASEDYERYGDEFEASIGQLVQEEPSEASFWVENNEVVFDEGR